VSAALRRPLYALLALCAGFGVLLRIVQTAGDPAPPDVVTRYVRLFSFFTLESNLLVCLVGVLVASGAAAGLAGRRWWSLLRLNALMGIVVTALVYWFVLAPPVIPFSSIVLHYVVPPLAVLVWALAGPWERRPWALLAPAMAWPVAYLAWTLVHGSFAHWYPYGFINADRHPAGTIARNAVLVALLLALVGALVLAVDRRRAGAGTPRT
jgi:hypothetical protein